MLRQQQDGTLSEKIGNDGVNWMTIAAYVLFVVTQTITFGFTGYGFYLLAALSLVSFGWIHFFKPGTYSGLTGRLGPLVGVLRWSGRHTLEIYVGHLLLFKAMALFLQPERFSLFQWTVFSS
jgi:uncharacterized membrane protein YcfT